MGPPQPEMERFEVLQEKFHHCHEGQSYGREYHGEGHCLGEDRDRSETTQFGYPKMRPRTTHQERQENRRLRTQRRLFELRRRERRSVDCRFWTIRTRRGRYSRS